MAKQLCVVIGRHTQGIANIQGGPCLNQQSGDFGISLPYSEDKCSLPVTTCNIQTGAGTNQDLRDFQLPLSRSIHQSRIATITAYRINITVPGQKELHKMPVPSPHCKGKQGHAPAVPGISGHSGAHKELYSLLFSRSRHPGKILGMIKKTRRRQSLLCKTNILSLFPGLFLLQPMVYHGP